MGERKKGDPVGMEEMPWFYEQAVRETRPGSGSIGEYDLNWPGHKPGVWPHVLRVGESWEGILRSHAREEVIKWRCGHTHLTQQAAKNCANWRFERRLDAKGIS